MVYRHVNQLAQHNCNNKGLAAVEQEVLYSMLTRTTAMSNIIRQLRILSTVMLAAFLIAAASVHAQTLNHRSDPDNLSSRPSTARVRIDSTQENDIVLANRAIAALKQLKADVIVYRSLQEFETDGRLGRVSFDKFNCDLQRIITEVEPILAQLTDSRLRTILSNALYSFRGGAFWWGKVAQPRVVSVMTLGLAFRSVAPAESFFTATVPYTVAIHWRQACKFLLQAEKLLLQNN